jgi:hypothetical protein
VDARGVGPFWWSERLWPVLAGTVLAVGLCAGVATRGLVMTAVSATMFMSLVAVCLYAAVGDDNMTPGRALRIGALAALAMEVAAGLGLLSAPIGWSAAGALVMTSPPVMERVAEWRRRSRARAVDRFDDAAVARRFEAIVARLQRDASSERDD